MELAAHYDREGADELVFLDITATHEKRDTIAELARSTADEVFVPFTIGGGIRSVADAQAVLDAGADKVSVNSAALQRPELIDELAERVRRPVRGARDRRQGAPAHAACDGTPADAPRHDPPDAGRPTSPAGAPPPGATSSSGRARRSSAGRGRSC